MLLFLAHEDEIPSVYVTSFKRNIFKEYFARVVSNMQFTGAVEIDESEFGRVCKFHRGRPRGFEVLVVGMRDFHGEVLEVRKQGDAELEC